MTSPPPIIYVVDDEPGMITALQRLLRTEGFEVVGYTSALDFLSAYRPGTDCCLVLDVAMPGLGGLDLQARLSHDGVLVPIVFLSGHADIPMSVQAMKAGAVDFLTKPVEADSLLRAVRAALARSSDQRVLARFSGRLTSLTPRERQVMEEVVAGKLNKQIAADLGTGEQNIKIHRGRVMQKMGVQSLAELVRITDRLRSPAVSA